MTRCFYHSLGDEKYRALVAYLTGISYRRLFRLEVEVASNCPTRDVASILPCVPRCQISHPTVRAQRNPAPRSEVLKLPKVGTVNTTMYLCTYVPKYLTSHFLTIPTLSVLGTEQDSQMESQNQQHHLHVPCLLSSSITILFLLTFVSLPKCWRSLPPERAFSTLLESSPIPFGFQRFPLPLPACFLSSSFISGYLCDPGFCPHRINALMICCSV